MTLLTFAISIALKLLTRVAAVDGRRQKSCGKWRRAFRSPRLEAATVRRHGISNQLLFGWRKAYREGQLGDTRGFVPAMIVAEQPEKRSEPGCGRIEIVSANGRRVIVDCDIDVETLLRIMRGLETLP